MKLSHVALLSLSCLFPAAVRGDDWIAYDGQTGPGRGKHVVFLSGDEEYRSEEGLPFLAKILSQRHGFKCTVLFAVDSDGTINPKNQTSLPGAAALDTADAVVMLLRYRQWPDDVMKHFADAYQRGVPIIGLRTSTHAFNYPRTSTSAYKSYNDFGKNVLGERWVNHWGRHKVEATRGVVEPSAQGDPLLRGVTDLFGDSDVYEAYPPADAKILFRGQVLKGMTPADPPADYRKRRSTDRQEQGINDPMMAVAWTRLHTNEAGKTNRVFCTTLGAATDLQNEGLRRLVVNAVYWGLGLDIPAQADVAYVGEYKPTMYGFDGFRKGVKPVDHALKPAAQEPPTDWIEPATGHRVLRLSRDPGTASLYFHQNPYTATGDKLFVTLANGLATVDLTALGTRPPKVERIADGKAATPIVGRKTRQVFYVQGGSVMATHLDTKATREVVKLPQGLSGASGLALNADETLLASTGSDPRGAELAQAQGTRTTSRQPGGRSMCLFTIDIKTGATKKILYGTDWFNHTQFSPTDAQQILFCHEGTWQEVDRIWTIRADGTGLKLMHPRTMPNEIAGHEFFSWDGKMVWYDLQTPRSQTFWLAGVDIRTGERLRYPVARSQWSVHFNQSHDGKLFAGDGGGPNSVANRTPLPNSRPLDPPGNGQWIFLFTPRDEPPAPLQVGGEVVKVGRFDAEKLVDLSKHNYSLEPNVTFTPDNKWIVFRSNMHGATHVYAVEVRKAL